MFIKNISIYSFIKAIFLLTIFLILAFFYIFIRLEQQNTILEEKNRYMLISNNILTTLDQNPTIEQIDLVAQKLHLKLIDDRVEKLNILKYSKIVFKREFFDARVRVLSVKNRYYIYIQKFGFNLMFFIKKDKTNSIKVAAILLVVILIIIGLLYFLIIKKLSPLRRLYQKIDMFKRGDLSVYIDIDSKDEIGQIAYIFNEAIKNIKELIESKNLFMRNIIHELKTPITKGLFLSNMIKTDQVEDKELLIKTFNTLNSIINQLSNIDKLKNNKLNIIKHTINLKDTITQIISMLDIPSSMVDLDIDDSTIIANKDLFGTLVKNLIENGFKYKKSGKIKIKLQNNILYIITKGDKLKNDLSYYTQPFTQDDKSKDGFGLGLYIVDEISKLHNFEFFYQYKDGYNIFALKIKK